MKVFHYTTGIAFLLLFLLASSSCEELITETDPCEDKICLNGGFCEDGTCICINGYTGSNCQIAPNNPDPCVVNNTATLCIKNESATNKTHDVILNNVRIMVLAVGERQCRTVTAGISYDVKVIATNTGEALCRSEPVVPQCSTKTLACQE